MAYGKGRLITPPMNKQEADAINQGRHSQYLSEASIGRFRSPLRRNRIRIIAYERQEK